MASLRDIKRFAVRQLRRPSMLEARSTRPVSDSYGFDRGLPIDRYYIDAFFAAHARDFRGRVLEIQDDVYTRRYPDQVDSRSILDIDPSNLRATHTADLASADSIADDTFDCLILPQTLQFIFDVASAIAHSHRILKPGGVMLATAPSLSRIDPALYSSDYWRFSPAACTRLFSEEFGDMGVAVSTYGNALSCAAFLSGMAVQELSKSELDPVDSHFPLIVAIRAVKGTP